MIIYQIVVFIIFAIFIFKVADYKGFSPWALVFTGLLGFLIMLTVPSANADDISEKNSNILRLTGNIIGLVVTGISLILSLTISYWLPKVFDLFV